MLKFAGTNQAAIAHTVAMLEGALENPRENFHIAMRMHAETLAGRDDILIEDAKRSKLDMGWIVVLVERKCESRIEPRNLVVPALFTGANLNHGLPPYCFGLGFV